MDEGQLQMMDEEKPLQMMDEEQLQPMDGEQLQPMDGEMPWLKGGILLRSGGKQQLDVPHWDQGEQLLQFDLLNVAHDSTRSLFDISETDYP